MNAFPVAVNVSATSSIPRWCLIPAIDFTDIMSEDIMKLFSAYPSINLDYLSILPNEFIGIRITRNKYDKHTDSDADSFR